MLCTPLHIPEPGIRRGNENSRGNENRNRDFFFKQPVGVVDDFCKLSCQRKASRLSARSTLWVDLDPLIKIQNGGHVSSAV